MAEKVTRSNASITTPYVVLYRLPEQSGQGWNVLADEDGSSDYIVESRGGEQAIRDALRLNSTLRQMAHDEGGVEVLVVPQRSYKPTPVRLVVQEPVIKIG